MLVILPLCAPSTYGQDAGVESIFFENGVGSRAQGMGNAFVALASDASAIFWNPAGIDHLPQQTLMVYYSTLLEANQQYVGYVYPFVNFGAIGVGVSRIGSDNIPITSPENDLISSSGSYGDEEYYFSYAKKLPSLDLSFGTNFKILRISSHDDQSGAKISGFGTGVDFGMMYKPSLPSNILEGMSFGLMIRNVVQPQTKLQTSTVKDPRTIQFGVAKDLFFGEEQLKKLTITTELNKSDTRDLKFKVGAELSLNRYMNLRTGLNEGRLALGFGTQFEQFQTFHFDYTFTAGGADVISPFHRVTLSVNFGKTIDERMAILRQIRFDEDQKLIVESKEQSRLQSVKQHRAIGKDFFDKGKWLPALVEFESLANLDPDNEEAALYLDSINMRMEEDLNTKLLDTALATKELTIMDEREKYVQENYKKGYEFVQKGDFIAALQSFELALEKNPNNATILEAMDDTRKLLDSKINSFIAKARASVASNNFAEALKLLSEARALDPKNQEIQTQIDVEVKRISNRLTLLETTRNALDAYQQGNYQEALELFEEALKMDPNNPTVKEYHKKSIVRAFATFKDLAGSIEKLYLKGVDLYVEGQYEKAIGIWQLILDKDPYNKRVLQAVEKAEEKLKRLEQQNK